MLCDALAKDSRSRAPLLAVSFAVALYLALACAWVAYGVLTWTLDLVGSAAGSVAWWVFGMAKAWLLACTWQPRIWALLPTCATLSGLPPCPYFLRKWWLLPSWWCLLGSARWALGGSLLLFLAYDVTGSSGFMYWSLLSFTLLRCASGSFAALWARLAVSALALAFFLLGLFFVAASDEFMKQQRAREAAGGGGGWGAPPLSTVAPAGAVGEVHRILSCATHFAVLEVVPLPRRLLMSDGDEEGVRVFMEGVKRAKHRKALLVHPDKCGLPHADAAFRRVQAAYEVLCDPRARAAHEEAAAQYASAGVAEAAVPEAQHAHAHAQHSQSRRKRR